MAHVPNPRGSAYTVIYNQHQESLVAVKNLYSNWWERKVAVGNSRRVANNPNQAVYPGGGLKPNQNPTNPAHLQAAAIREWQEETGLKITTAPWQIEFGHLPAPIRNAMTAAGYDITPIPIVQHSTRDFPLAPADNGYHHGALRLQISDLRMVDITEAFRRIEAADRAAYLPHVAKAPVVRIRKDDELAAYHIVPRPAVIATFVAQNRMAHPHAPAFPVDRMDTTWLSDIVNDIPIPAAAVAPAAPQLAALAGQTHNPALLAIIARYATADAAVFLAIFNNGAINGLTRTAIASNNSADAVSLNTLVARNEAALDTLIAARPLTSNANLRTLAQRPNAAALVIIAARADADAQVFLDLLNNGAIDGPTRTAIASNNSADAVSLNTLTARDEAALDALIIARPHVAHAALITIANRRPALRAQIAALPAAALNPAVMAAAAPPGMFFAYHPGAHLVGMGGLPPPPPGMGPLPPPPGMGPAQNPLKRKAP
jgi:8-oxo-dGTP pyrophosphatase MutT (NUDIX family)